jgi:phosphotransferase system enzyme I (PtsP)
MPETGEERFSSFLGLPIQRLGELLGVLVVQSKTARKFTTDEIYALEVVAMVLAEMAELGAFVSEESGLKALHQQSILIRGSVAQEGATKGNVWLHEPRVVVTNLVSDDPEAEVSRLEEAVQKLRNHVDGMLEKNRQMDKEQAEILEAYKMFANSRGWMKRMVTDINSGLSAEAAVDKEQSSARARLGQATDPYMRDRLHDLDDLSNRLLRILTGQGKETGASMPQNPILVASNIGPAELLDYGRSLKGIVLEEGSVGSHATIVARALAIPLVIHAQNITAEALNGDEVLVDGEQGLVHLRPDESVSSAFKDKIAMEAKAQERYSAIRHLPANTLDQSKINLLMNAGLMADLPSLDSSGAEGVGLFRTELQFLIRNQMPKRSELSAMYKRVMDAAGGKTVVFRSLDIGSDKVLSYMPNVEEPNPALGWRAIRVGLDKPGVLRMQLQALLRAAEGRPLSVMFPFIAQASEFNFAKLEMEKVKDRELKLGHKVPKKISLGAMLETPSLAYESQSFFQEVDFLSIGGNDLKQFFFAADRENELVRKRYDTLNLSFIDFLQMIVEKCKKNNTNLSFCGEDAGRPVEALCLAAIGIKTLSMRPASIGPVKNILLRSDLGEVRKLINNAKNDGEASVRKKIVEYMSAG